MNFKRFKDPIYGYIEIDEKIITQVIDTAPFQRLRDVIQTSYAPLYSSAVHNRFVHSLGVYHLGKLAAESFILSLREKTENLYGISDYKTTFELACLLHDVGHAPFSHTGENFYLEKGDRIKLHEELIRLTNDPYLEKEISDNSYKAAPHELMSAIVSLNVFSTIIPDSMKSFFARCIIGYKYTLDMDIFKSCENCFIELLNSKIIDVDKLDYLLRDSYMTGFDSTSIDYERLLKSICAVQDKRGFLRICYNKAAVSVIENVVYAHDAERKWIQNHPIVLYEANLIENAINQVIHEILDKETLTYNLLTEPGITTKEFGTVRLISDSDIVYLMKNLTNCPETVEYYNRNSRKHPLWKTEAEFQAIFLGREKELQIILDEFDTLRTYLRSLGLPFIINAEALSTIQEEITLLEDIVKTATGYELERTEVTLIEKKRHLSCILIFEQFSINANIPFDFLIIYANQFNSGFRKQEFGNIEFVFPELKKPCRFEDVSNVLTSSKSRGEKFFFLYYTRKDEKRIKITELIQNLLNFATDIRNEELGNRLL